MMITDVRVRRINKEGKMRAVVSVTLDEQFVIHDIKLIQGEKGMFLAMPSRKGADGEYRDMAHPINSDMRNYMQSKIEEAYNQSLLDNEELEETEEAV